MTYYRHIDPQLSREQQENFVLIARQLVLSVTDARTAPGVEFEMGQAALDLITGDELAPDQVALHAGPMLCGPVGFAPLAGIAALTGETWRDYQVRVLGAAFDDPLEDWLLSVFWRQTDNTAVGAAMRMMYVLDYGVPGDWEAILHGEAQSDYRDNGFLWDRVGLMPPEKT